MMKTIKQDRRRAKRDRLSSKIKESEESSKTVDIQKKPRDRVREEQNYKSEHNKK